MELTLTLTLEIESAIKKQASQTGTTPEKLALDSLRMLFVPGIEPADGPPASLADFLHGYIGVIRSSESVAGGAQMSEETGKQFAKLMTQKRIQGHL